MEQWRNIEGYEGIYQISDLGRVKSMWFGREKILKPTKNKKGYLFVDLCKDKINKKYKIHRLVCINFLDNPENKEQVNHINGIKDDNRIENLEWSSASENIQHAYDTGLKKPSRGSKHMNRKLTEKQVLEIRSSNLTQRELGRIYGVSKTHISDIKNRKCWHHI